MVRPIGRFVAAAGLLFILVATLVPIPQQALAASQTPWWCLVCGDRGGVDVLNNLLLFLPFAFGLRLAGVPTRVVVVLGALLSLSIELLQATVVPGRDASLSDVLTNSAGGGVGAWIAAHRGTLLFPSKGRSRWLALSGGGLWLLAQLASGSLLQPWVPGQELRAVRARHVYGHPRYEGQITSSTISGLPVPVDSSRLSENVTRALRSDKFQLGVTMTASPYGRWSPVLEVLGSGAAVLALEANRRNLTFKPPMRSSVLRLARPALLIPGALAAKPGTQVHLMAGEDRSRLWADWTAGREEGHSSQTLSPSFGWSLLLPFPYAFGPQVRLLTILWLAGWLLPTGYWTAHSGDNPFARALSLVLLVCCGLALVPLVLDYPAVHWSEWMGAFLGIAGGALGQRWATYFENR